LGASSRSDPTPREARPEPRVRGGLALRMAIPSLLLALLVGSAFAVLLRAVSDLRASERLVAHSREANAAADRLEELVIDLETGVRGFVIARQERFLEPWRAARAASPDAVRVLERLADRPEQQRRVRVIARGIASYITEYSIPLVNATRKNEPAAQSIATTAAGKRRVDELSGGNIQRLVLLRELGDPATLVIAAYPSRGLDVATTRRTQELLLEQRASGAGVLLISEDLDELFEMSDRIVVMHNGEIVGEVDPSVADRYEVGRLMMGTEEHAPTAEPDLAAAVAVAS